MSVEEVMAIVEQDGWIYDGEEPRDGRSYVCSSFVAAVWKASGLLDYDFNATELGPGDIYKLKIFESNPTLPEQCVAADPELPYCQLLGNYKFELPIGFYPDYSLHGASLNDYPYDFSYIVKISTK